MDLLGRSPKPVLGIESSCDETAAAVLAPDGTILAEAVLSQTEDHARFGGVVPELAARSHLSHLPALVAGVMARAGVAPRGLGGVAATSGPGLIGGLIVGASFGKGMALANGLPFVAVNHLEAHALTPRLPGLIPGGVAFPYLLLLLSGGHCQCVAVEGLGRYRRLGTTLDDAVGEAFDKAAKLLGLPWPGGPHLERLAASGEAARVPLPRPLLGRAGCDFSFSGLKTAVAQVVAKGAAPADVAASFQAAVAAVVADRARHALAMAPLCESPGATALVVSGGVAANAAVRAALTAVAEGAGLPMVAPPVRLCTDNAVMVAWAGIERLRAGLTDPWDHAPRPRWPLDEMRGPMNYRHAFHAANFADCMKHALLHALVAALARKPAPFRVLDTHAGIGLYDLQSEEARRTGEWRDGIGRLETVTEGPLLPWLTVVRSFPRGTYPGSPALVRAMLREADHLALCELHPEDHAALRAAFRDDARVSVHRRDAWEAVTALTPFPERRGLVLFDPPYEAEGELDRLAAAMARLSARFRGAVQAAWYPVKHRAPVRAFHDALAASGMRDVIACELWLREPTDPARLNGCGLAVVNPPFGFADAARSLLAALHARLYDGERGGGWAVTEILPE